jgi:two-component system, OmpR family, response regulator
VSPALVAPADGSFRGAGQESPLPLVTFRWNTPPSVGRSKGGEVPQLHRPLFCLIGTCQVALHEDADRAMVNRKQTHLTATDPQMRLLIIEDDRESADYLVKAFREVGYVADLASDGEEGLALADSGDYDVLVIDRMLPKRDGLSLIGTLREKGNRTPALILSALGQVDDRIKGLRAGGDDYLPKPYSFAELLARVEVLSRRHGGPAEETAYRVGDLELDRLSHRVARGKDELTLQPREFRLLEYLMKHAGQVVTRTMLLENVWDYHFDPQTNVIDVHISRLRSKIDKGFERPLLHTIRGAGYMIRDGIR